jgi:uncharacterized protein YutD
MNRKIFFPLILIVISFIYFSANQIKAEESKMMEKFDFLIGDWNMKYNIPKSSFSEKTTGSATGTFKRALDNKYVIFDY